MSLDQIKSPLLCECERETWMLLVEIRGIPRVYAEADTLSQSMYVCEIDRANQLRSAEGERMILNKAVEDDSPYI